MRTNLHLVDGKVLNAIHVVHKVWDMLTPPLPAEEQDIDMTMSQRQESGVHERHEVRLSASSIDLYMGVADVGQIHEREGRNSPSS